MWYVVEYLPATLFSLKNSNVTNMAAKSIIAPSPYSIKMALLDKIITFTGYEKAKQDFNYIKKLKIQYSLSPKIVVNNCFIKIHKQPKEKKIGKNFQPTVSFREFVSFNNTIKIAININEASEKKWLDNWLVKINYFGKRGCFFQYKKSYIIEQLQEQYSSIIDEGLHKRGMLVQMDDFDDKTTLEKVDNYSKKTNVRKELLYLFPYTQERATKDFTILTMNR